MEPLVMLPLTIIGLTIDGIGAVLVVLPEIPKVGAKVTEDDYIRELDEIHRILYPIGDTESYTLAREDDTGFERLADIVEDRLGQRPTAIRIQEETGSVGRVDFNFDANQGERTGKIEQPHVVADWIKAEQENRRNKRKSRFISIGAFLIALGIAVQTIGTI